MTDEQEALVRVLQIEHSAIVSSGRTKWQKLSDNGRIRQTADAFFDAVDRGEVQPWMTDRQIADAVRSGIGSIMLWWIGRQILQWAIYMLIRKLWPDRPTDDSIGCPQSLLS